MLRQTSLVVTLLGVTLLLAGCSLLGPKSGGTLTYTGPTEQSISMGGGIPGTDIRYVGYRDAGAEVLIADQAALKKPGDSLDWKGTPVPGVDVTLSQRVLTANPQHLQTVGTVKVVVHDAAPQPAGFPAAPAYTYKVAVTYNVPKGKQIPGTQISYVGKTDQGAEFGGVSGYPYRKLGDSIIWTGRLRHNAYLDTTLRVIAYADSFVQVAGLATLGLTQ